MKPKAFFQNAIAALLIVPFIQLHAQQDTAKSPVKISLSYSQINDQPPVLKAAMKIKKGKKFEALSGAEVKIWFSEETPQGLIGQFKTDKKGSVSVALPPPLATQLDSLSPLKFIAAVSPSAKWDEEKTEIEITRARIDLTLVEVDSVKKIEAKVLAIKEGKWMAVPQTEIKLFVKRLFSDFPLGNNLTTDDAGAVSSAFNIQIPGDVGGNIIVGAKIEDSEVYGTIAGTKTMKWGTPLKPDNSFYKRTLWAARDKTPYWLLITPNIIIVTVWGFIIYLLYLVQLIRKLGKDEINS